MNKKLPDYFLGKYEIMGSMAFSVIFAVIFLSVFIPAAGMSWSGYGNSMLFLFSAAFIIFSLVLIIVSRVVMYHSKKWLQMTYLIYILWCMLEVILVCLIYTVLSIFVIGPDDVEPVRLFWNSLLYGFAALIIPYTISGMYLTILDRNKTIRKLAARRTSLFKSGPAGGGEGRISLYDSGGGLKLSVKSSNLYFIESDDNYVKVWYMDSSNTLKTRMIRCRLKAIEEEFKESSLMRCNRKFIVNIDKVKVLSKESDGYYLDLGNAEIAPIAVTKSYQANVLSKFSQK